MKKIMLTGLCFFIYTILFSQTSLSLSVHSSSDTTKPLIFYISGDGGFNKFSNSFMQTLNKQGYAVIGLDAKDYFWHKKKPLEAANAIEQAINKYNNQWKRKNVILIGYSFGGDVAPFMLTHFTAALAARINHLVLLSPSPKTDFEIHVLQMLGWGKNSGESVATEINKINQPVLIIMGDDEDGFPLNELTIKNKQVIKMPGGHHYDGNVEGLCKQITISIK
ncbi:MAG TPA: AcvB/VirJ family lysyl-phosphatidylglycerol hydrolase [Chitinophagaceae bacterium]|nr:AcvB/VirJ family lysyl-phosphatidylglycerol hydrolase [Chitinophagaceae bacterium]